MPASAAFSDLQGAANYNTRRTFVARATSRDNKHFIWHGICICARLSRCCSAGSNPSLDKQLWRDYPIDVSATWTPRLPDANLRHQAAEPSTGANGQMEDATYFFCPCSFDRAVMVAQWCVLRLERRETRVRTLPFKLASSCHVQVTTRSSTRMSAAAYAPRY